MTRKTLARRQRDSTPKPVSIQKFFTDRIADTRKGFLQPVRITIIVRTGEGPEQQIIYGDDNLDALITVLTAGRDQFVAKQQELAAVAAAGEREDATDA